MLRTLSCAVVLFAFAGSASAFETTGNDVADAFLKTLLGENDRVVSVGDYNVDGDMVRLENIETAPKADAADGERQTLASVEIIGAQESADGILVADTITIADWRTKLTDGDTHMAATELRQQRLIPSMLSINAVAAEAMAASGSWTVEGATMNFADETVEFRLEVETMSWSSSARDPDVRVGGTAKLSGIKVSTSIEDEAMPALPDLGDGVAPGDLAITFDWNATDGALTLDPMTLSIPGLFDLTVMQDITGYTVKNASGLMPADGGDPTPESLANVMLGEGTVTLTDRGFVDVIVQQSALAMGLDEAMARTMTAQMLSGMLLGVGDLERTGAINAAAMAFLGGSGNSVTFTFAPAEPVPLSALAEAATPGEVMNLLGVEVSLP